MTLEITSSIQTEIYVLKPLPPVISPGSGTFSATVTVSITCATAGATIRYTTDGSEPTESSTEYTVPFDITVSTNVKAKAFKTGWSASNTAGAVYVIYSISAMGPTYWTIIGYTGAHPPPYDFPTWDGTKYIAATGPFL